MENNIDPSVYELLEQKFIDDNKLKIGDKVKVTHSSQDGELGWNNIWIMDEYIDQVGIIEDFGHNSEGIKISFPDELTCHFSYPYFVLEKVQ